MFGGITRLSAKGPRTKIETVEPTKNCSKMKKTYIQPTIEVMEAKIEKGFAGSNLVPEPQTTGTEAFSVGQNYVFS